MITVGTKVCITDFTDFLLQEGSVKRIKNGKAIIKFPGIPGEYVYDLDDVEEVHAVKPQKEKTN